MVCFDEPVLAGIGPADDEELGERTGAPGRALRAFPIVRKSLPRSLAASLLAGCLLGLLGGCGDGQPRPNVLFVVIDTLRSDYCSCYGYPLPTTPVLDELAAEGVRFANVYTPIPTTGPAHASLFTARPPLIHGVLKNGHVLAPEAVTLAEILQRQGYDTAAFVSAFPVNRKFGFSQGFETYDDDFKDARSPLRAPNPQTPGAAEVFERRADETNDKALDWLRKRSASGNDNPFFLWMHYYDPHTPHTPPPRFARAFLPRASRQISSQERMKGLYSGEIRFTDEQLGTLLDAIESASPAENTLIVITSDHGEGLMDHDWMGHGLLLYEEALKVPFVMRWTGRIEPGRVVEAPVALMDIVPTLLELLEISGGREGMMGESQASRLAREREGAGEAGARDRRLVFQRRFYEIDTVKGHPIKGDKFALLWNNWKYIEAVEEDSRELFDLQRDPGELNNLVEIHLERRATMSRALNDAIDRMASLASGGGQRVSEDDAKRLEALGYGR